MMTSSTKSPDVGGEVEHVTVSDVMDIAGLILYDTEAVPIRLKVLLDRLLSSLSHDQVLHVLVGYGWAYDDFCRGYKLQDASGRLLSSWTIASADEERLVLAQFLRFSLTRKVAERFLMQLVQQHGSSGAELEPQLHSGAGDDDVRRKQLLLLHEQMTAAAMLERLRARQLALQAACSSDPTAAGLLFPYAAAAAGYNTTGLAAAAAAAASGYPYGTVMDFSLRSLHQPLLGTGTGAGFEGLKDIGDMARFPGAVLDPKTPLKGAACPRNSTPSSFTSPLKTALSSASYDRVKPQSLPVKPSLKSQSSQGLGCHFKNRLAADEAINYSVSKDKLKVRDARLDGTGSPSSPRLTASKPPLPPGSLVRPGAVGGPPGVNRRQAQPTPGYGGTLISPTGKRRVLCTACQKTFCDKGALKIHYSAVHLREMHRCTIAGCDMVFSSRRSRNRHSANPNPKLHSADSGSHVIGATRVMLDGGGSSRASRSPSPVDRLYRTSSDPAIQYTDQSSDDDDDNDKDNGNGNVLTLTNGDVAIDDGSVERGRSTLDFAEDLDSVTDGSESRQATRVGSKRKRSVPTRWVAQHSGSYDLTMATNDADYNLRLTAAIDDDLDEDDVSLKQQRQEPEDAQTIRVKGHDFGSPKVKANIDYLMTSSHDPHASSCRRNLIGSFGAGDNDSLPPSCDVISGNSRHPLPVGSDSPKAERVDENCNSGGENNSGDRDPIGDVLMTSRGNGDVMTGSCSQQLADGQSVAAADMQHICTVPGCNAVFPSKRSRDRHSSNLNLHRKLLSTSEPIPPSPPSDSADLAAQHRSLDDLQLRPHQLTADPSPTTSVLQDAATTQSDAESISGSSCMSESGEEDQLHGQNGVADSRPSGRATPLERSSTLATCHLCQQTFRDNLVLKEHVETLHPREMFPCTVDGCNKIFSTRKSRNRHSQNDNLHRNLPLD